jgi:hypothetical protein
MDEMPVTIVGNLPEAISALKIAASQETPVTLRSPPFASASLGAAGFLAIVKAAREAVPGVPSEAILDCGDAPGHALGALRLGAEAVSITAPDDVLAKLAEIAAQTGARIYQTSPSGELHAILPANSPAF